ncbi:archease [Candidatus Bathyarchaeota archaeon]|nr:MAG: archease [Candidatus Bathyarchaeota archaeon]
MKKFEFLEHMADAYIAAYGKDLAEAFENAALAMFETMTDTAKVEPKIEDEIEVEGFDEQSLLYNWLESLIVKFEMTGNLYSKFKIIAIEKTENGFRLKAKVWGEPFNPEKHPQKVGIKAVTYHMMEVKKETGKVTVKFLLDL